MQADTEAKRGRWAMATMFGTNGFLMGAWAPQIPLLLPRYQITETTLGLLIFALGLGAIAAMLFAGRLIDTHGSRRVLIFFSLAAVPMLMLVVFSPSLWTVAPSMALFGALLGSMDASINANTILVERRLGRPIMSSSHGFWSLGGFVGGSAGSYAIVLWGPEVQVICATVIALVLVLLAIPHVLHDSPAPHQAGTAKPAKSVILPRDLGLWLLGFMALFSMVPEGAILDWAAIYLSKELGADMLRSGLAFAFFAGAMAVMRFVGDGLRHRLGAVRTLRLSGVVGAIGMMGGAIAPNDVVAIASFAFAGIGIANMVPILFSAAGNHPGLPAGTAISIVTMVGYAGILIAPSSIGFVAEHAGFRFTYAALSLLLILVAALAGRTATADHLHKQ